MADYGLSQRADEDLGEIYLLSYQRFGEARANAYLLALEERFLALAEQPLLGRRIEHIRAGYFRCEHGSHAIFYKLADRGITVMRVLHRSMESGRHF